MQIFLRIQEDVKVVSNVEEINNEREEGKEMAILLDLKKVYPKVKSESTNIMGHTEEI